MLKFFQKFSIRTIFRKMNFRKSDYSSGVEIKLKNRENSKSICRRDEYFRETSIPLSKSSNLQNFNSFSRPSSTNESRHSRNTQLRGKKKVNCEKVHSGQKLISNNSNSIATATVVLLWDDVEDNCNSEHKKSINIFVNSKINENSTELGINIKRPLTLNQLEIKRKSVPSILRIGMSPCPSRTFMESYRQKKQVTFAVERGRQYLQQRNNSAETKRLFFRNSHNKISKISDNPSHSVEDDEILEFENNTPAISAITEKPREKSITLSTPTGINNENQVNKNTSSDPTKDNHNIDIDKNKMIKRKLKSCRSRSFHKSLNVASFTDIHDKNNHFTHTKPFKETHPEIVTMVSLVPPSLSSSTDEKNEEIENKISSKLNLSVHTKKKVNDDQQENAHSKIDHKSASKNIFSTNTKINMSIAPNTTRSESRLIGHESNDAKKRITIQSIKCVMPTNNLIKSISFIENSSSSKSTKEEECLSSFHKMNNEGMNVSFDTILRGLLTPTEYRLRKNDCNLSNDYQSGIS